jgi:hypothetical protein
VFGKIKDAVKAVTPGGTESTIYKEAKAGSDNWSIGGTGGKDGRLGSNDAIGTLLDKNNPFLKASKAAKEKEEADKRALEEWEAKKKAANDGLTSSDSKHQTSVNTLGKDYLTSQESSIGQFIDKMNGLEDKAKTQMSSSDAMYSNTIIPEFKNLMESSKQNAAGAMSLEEAMDPNNKIHTQIRELYDNLGKQSLQQGRQDYGVLSALGAQAAKGQFGVGQPMTAGMMGQIYAQNQNQAGEAFARAQQRMYDLQQQGIDRGFDENRHWYEQGQLAQDRYGNTVKDLTSAQNLYDDSQSRYRDELSGYAGNISGANSALASDKYNIGLTDADLAKANEYGKIMRESGLDDSVYAQKGQLANNSLGNKMADYQNEGQTYGAIAKFFTQMMGGKGTLPKQAG